MGIIIILICIIFNQSMATLISLDRQELPEEEGVDLHFNRIEKRSTKTQLIRLLFQKICLMLVIFVAGAVFRDLVAKYQTKENQQVVSVAKAEQKKASITSTKQLSKDKLEIELLNENKVWEYNKVLFGFIAADKPSQNCLILNEVAFSPNLENYRANKLNLIIVFDHEREKVKVKEVFPEMLFEYAVMDSSNKMFLETVGFRCNSYVLLDSRLIVPEKLLIKLTETMKNKELSNFLIVGNDKIYRQDNKVVDLPNLTEIDLSTLDSSQLRKYVISFSRTLLSIVTPLNFQLYSRYSLIEMLAMPIVSMTIGSDVFSVYKSDITTMPVLFEDSSVKYREYQLNQLPKDQSHVCFISYPVNPYFNSKQHLRNYLNSTAFTQENQRVSLIVFLKIEEKTLWDFVKIILETKNKMKVQSTVKLVLRPQKVVCSLSIYEAVYGYCPSSALIVSSRQHVVFEKGIVNETREQFTKQIDKHLLIANYKKQNKQIKIPPLQVSNRRNASYNSDNFNVQFFRSDRFKMINVWYLKCDQIDFYEQQASYMYHILEITGKDFMQIDHILYTVTLELVKSERQSFQFENLRYYYIRRYSPNLSPYPLNSLQNYIFKKSHLRRQLIPKKFHQIWIGNHSISPIRIALAKTLTDNNPDYEYFLWRDQNITEQNFPFTFKFIERVQQKQKQNPEHSFAALIADVMRAEILYHNGGIYMDFKTEIRRSLDPWLKYKIYFNDLDYINYGQARWVGPGHYAAAPHNPNIEKFLRVFHLKPNDIDVDGVTSRVTGGYVMRKYFSEEYVFQQAGIGGQLLSPNPDGTEYYCERSKVHTPDQQLFEVVDNESQEHYQIGVPCKLFPQSYSYFYLALGKTWIAKNKHEWN